MYLQGMSYQILAYVFSFFLSLLFLLEMYMEFKLQDSERKPYCTSARHA